VAEQMRGLQALLSQARSPDQIGIAYSSLDKWLMNIGHADIVPWSAPAAAMVDQLFRSRQRSGTMDLRIAAIAMAYNATLLSRNLRDFGRIAGLKVENWLDGCTSARGAPPRAPYLNRTFFADRSAIVRQPISFMSRSISVRIKPSARSTPGCPAAASGNK
jgi:hypothetical protein